MPVEQRFTANLIRGLTFVRKELLTVWRQPRLMATLILGPFLILLLFGLGYRETPEPFQTLIVVDEEASLASDPAELEEAFGAGIDLVGTTPDLEEAERQLLDREVDLLIVAPENALEALDQGERATFTVVHSQIDPVLISNINLLARLSVDEFNRRLLRGLITEAQVASEQLSGTVVEAENPDQGMEQLRRFQQLDPELLVSPFQVETTPTVETPATQAVFYAPGVVVLLIQHLAVTFAALSLVRERALGITDIFHVSPLSVRQAMTGKYLAFLVLGLALAAVLIATTLVLGVRIEGPLWSLAAVVTLVILASLGLGFAMSGLAKSDSQAVQYSMVVLLFSIFFTGFVLPLDQLTSPVRWVSYLIPGTYGIAGLQQVMFRGQAAEPLVLAGLAGYAVVMGWLAWLALRKDVEIIRT